MGRPKKNPEAANPVPPVRRRAPRTLGDQIAARSTLLDNRAREAAQKARMRKRLRFEVPLDDYEQVVEFMERWGDSAEVIVRACFLHGLDYYRQFASSSAPYSPFTRGYRIPPTPAQLDPRGTHFPPPPVQTIFDRPVAPPPATHYGAEMYERRPVGQSTVMEYDEPIFGRPSLPPGLFPQGQAPTNAAPPPEPQAIEIGLPAGAPPLEHEIPFEPEAPELPLAEELDVL